MMTVEIRILGTRGNVESTAPKHRLHSGMLVDERLLFDLGEERFLDPGPEHVFITHLHSDHAFFMERGSWDEWLKDSSAVFYAPEKDDRFPLMKVLAGSQSFGPYKVSPILAVHSNKVLSYSYLIEKGGRSVLYTGDLIEIRDTDNLPSHLDIVVTDGSFIRRGGMVRRDPVSGEPYGHAGIPDLVDVFKKHSGCILFTHYGEWFYRDVAKANERIRSYSGEALVRPAYDGMVAVI